MLPVLVFAPFETTIGCKGSLQRRTEDKGSLECGRRLVPSVQMNHTEPNATNNWRRITFRQP